MSLKSDFAQKLLSDLRTRKERMAAAQNSSRQSTQTTSRAVHGNKGSRQTNTSRRHENGSTTKPINTRESSNQMVLYGRGQKSSQLKVGDLSMAIAFAFESNGNLTTIGTSTTNNPLANFFNRFNRRSRDTHKTDIMTFGNRGQLPTVSNIHITEVSKGVQKLNQILQACSNGFSLDGKELLKGAIDLEESLRMLVELQEGSQYGNDTQKNKSRLRLLDDDDEEEDENVKIAEQWKLDRPKFSFDKHRVDAHKRSASYGQDLSLSSSSHSVQSQKKGISNVVAKLMGLDEIPRQEDFRFTKNDPKGNASKQSSDFSEALSRESNKRAIQVNEHQVLNVSQRKQNSGMDKQSTMQVSLNNELKRKGQNSKTTKATESKTHDDRVRQKFGANSIDKEVARNQQKPEEKVVPKRGGHSEDVKVRNEKKDQHAQRQISKAKNNESLQVKTIIPAKPKKSTVVKKKSTRDESAHGNVKSTKASEEVPTKDQKSKIHQVEVSANGEQVPDVSARETQLDMEKEKRKPKDKPSEVSPKQNKAPIIPRKVQRSEIPQKIDVLMSRRNVNHLTRSIKEPADRSNMLKDLKQRLHSKNSFSKRTEEQRQDNKQVEDEKAEVISNAPENKNIHEQATKQEMLQNEDEHRVIPKNTSTAEEHQTQKLQNTSTPEDHSDDITLISRKVEHHQNTLEDEQELKQCDQLYTYIAEEHQTQKTSTPEDHSDPNTLEDEQELKQCDHQYTRKEQLTEHETKLKEIIIKSQTLLSTADALFKLNIPVSLLHTASEQQEYYESADNKLVLECTNEVMRRKARRYKDRGTCNLPKVRSLDDLIRQVAADMEKLESYGGDGGDDVAAWLHKMVERDVDHNDVDVNCMWEIEWSNVRSFREEKECVVREVERWVFNSLIDEFTKNLDLDLVS